MCGSEFLFDLIKIFHFWWTTYTSVWQMISPRHESKEWKKNTIFKYSANTRTWTTLTHLAEVPMKVTKFAWRKLRLRLLVIQAEWTIIHNSSLMARFMGPTWGPSGPRWTPCWPYELCYLGYLFHCWYFWNLKFSKMYDNLSHIYLIVIEIWNATIS